MTSYTPFGGDNVLPVIDGWIEGELADIRWKKSLDVLEEYPVTGTITCTVFMREPLERHIGKIVPIDLIYWQEPENRERREQYQFGNYQAYTIVDAEITSYAGGVGIEDITEERIYTFKATDVFFLPEYSGHPTDQDEFIEYMDTTRSVKTDREIALYDLYKRDQERRHFNESEGAKQYDCQRFMRKGWTI